MCLPCFLGPTLTAMTAENKKKFKRWTLNVRQASYEFWQYSLGDLDRFCENAHNGLVKLQRILQL